MRAIPFDLQPVLEGELLRLRPLQASDFDDLFAVAADPLIWEQHPAPDRYKEEQFRTFFRESLESAGALIAIDRRDGRIIGSSRFHGYDRERSEIEIGWTFLARSHWGGRYNGEMKRLMLLHAFRFVDRVVFLVAALLRFWRPRDDGVAGDGAGLVAPEFDATSTLMLRSTEAGVAVAAVEAGDLVPFSAG